MSSTRVTLLPRDLTPRVSACQKICQGRVQGSRPTTPNHFVARPYPSYVPSPTNGYVQAIPGPPHSPGSNSYQVIAFGSSLLCQNLWILCSMMTLDKSQTVS